MKTNMFFLLLFFFVAMSSVVNTSLGFTTNPNKDYSPESASSYSHGMNNFLGRYNPGLPMTCDNYPGICKATWSPGQDCCQRRCVNLKFDPFNCGRCGATCKFGQMCCQGRCVNIMYDKDNCGWCNNKCGEGSFCRYGMCSYA